MGERFTTPVGRFVQGDAWEPQTKDQQGNPRVVKSGPNVGQPNPQYFIAIAFPKNDPLFPAFYAILDRVARAEWPQYFPTPGGPCSNPKFAWKVIDGDGFDTNGKPNNQKEGFAGCWVVRFGSSFPPKVFHTGRYAPAEQVFDKAALRRGYYIRINGSVEGNKNTTNPGLYVNLDMIEIAGYGQEIISGPSAADAFAQPAPLPQGASATPLAAGAPAPAAAPYVPPAPGAPAPAPAPAPAAPAPQHTAYMVPGAPAPAPAAPAPAPAPPPAPPAGPTMTAAAQYTYDQYRTSGWTDEQLRAQGLMV